MITVTITELYGERTQHISCHRTIDRDEAITRAIRKAYGARRFLYKDFSISGPTTLCGQLGRRLPGSTRMSVMDPGRIAITTTP